MSDPNTVTGKPAPGDPEQHADTAGWVPPGGRAPGAPRTRIGSRRVDTVSGAR